MINNPLITQNNASRDSMMLGKAGGLKGKNYLFSDIMQVYLGGNSAKSAKFDQFLAEAGNIDVNDSTTNLLKLTEGNIPSQNDVKFDLLLKLLGLSTDELPEQTGISLDIPEVTLEELNAILAKITKNADNEIELNKVIKEKIGSADSENDENLLVTLEFDQKTIAIDIVPTVELSVSNGVDAEGNSELSTKAASSSNTFNMTVSILPSDLSDDIISKFVEATHLLKKEAEGTTPATLTAAESQAFKVFKESAESEITGTPINQKMAGLVKELGEATPDKAKKVTIYSVLNEVTETETTTEKKNEQIGFADPLKQIKINNQSASLNSENKVIASPENTAANILANKSTKSQNVETVKIIKPEVATNVKTAEFATIAPEAKVLKNTNEKSAIVKPLIEGNSEETKAAVTNVKSESSKTASAEMFKELVAKTISSNSGKTEQTISESSSAKTPDTIKVENAIPNAVKVENTNTVKTATTAEKEILLPANEKIKISIKPETATNKITDTLQTKADVEKPVILGEVKELKDLENIQKSTVKTSATEEIPKQISKPIEENKLNVVGEKRVDNKKIELPNTKVKAVDQIKESVSIEKTTKPNESIGVKAEGEVDKPNQSTVNSSETNVLKEISGIAQNATDHQSSKQNDSQTTQQFNFVQNVESTERAANSFKEVLSGQQAEKVVKHADVVKEVHHFIERKDSTQLVLKVQPAELGKVKITLDLSDHLMKANIEVESEAVRQTLERSMGDLQSQLNKTGIQLGSVNISLQDPEKQNRQQDTNKKKNNNKTAGGEIIENETGETQAGKTLGYNTYDYVV